MGSVFVVNMRFALYLLHLIFLRIYTYIIKKVYGATSLKAAEAEFERFKQAWSQYPGHAEIAFNIVREHEGLRKYLTERYCKGAK